MLAVVEFLITLLRILSSVVTRSSDPSIVPNLLVSCVDDLVNLYCCNDESSSDKPSAEGGN